jgi:alkylation response protein AidB-like acyl-CoA dehydrogenase
MLFQFTDEQQQFADALGKWASRAYGFEHRRRVVRGQADTAAEWRALADLGLTALGVPHEQGGLAGGGIDHLIAMQEAGRSLLAAPLFATLWGSAFLRLAGGHDAWLERVATGEARLACAVFEAAGRHEAAMVECLATPCEGGWRLAGSKSMVVHGEEADALIVSARSGGESFDCDGITLFVIAADTPGLVRSGYPTADGLRAATVTFNDVMVPASALLGAAGAGWTTLDAACDFGTALLCAEAIGLMEAMQADTLDHLRNRQQFGQPIAGFQALQHRMADMFIHLEQARSMAWLAAVKTDPAASTPAADAAERRRCVSAAKARVGEALRFVGQQAVQLHGGIGVSDEARITHLFRRACAVELTLGDSDHHVARFAAQPDLAA